MNGSFRFLLLVQASITVVFALLAAFLIWLQYEELASVIIGASTMHWFRETSVMGRAARDDTRYERASEQTQASYQAGLDHAPSPVVVP